MLSLGFIVILMIEGIWGILKIIWNKRKSREGKWRMGKEPNYHLNKGDVEIAALQRGDPVEEETQASGSLVATKYLLTYLTVGQTQVMYSESH